MNNKKIATSVLIILLLLGGLLAIKSIRKDEGGQASEAKTKAVVYKSPDCGCCVKHVAYLRGKDYNVEIINTQDTDSIKNEYRIPWSLQSCHTTVIGNYFVEGHVPIEAINKLLKESPEIDGIALPGMPAGSPGMPGLKTEEFEIYSLKNGVPSDFIKI